MAGQVELVSETLKKPYEELVEQLPEASHVHADETEWQEKGKQERAWAFRSTLVTVFTIAGTRGSEVLEKVDDTSKWTLPRSYDKDMRLSGMM